MGNEKALYILEVTKFKKSTHLNCCELEKGQ